MNLAVNGVTHAVASPLLTPLLDVLREELGITGPKAGCHQGGCGACTVLVDGQPRRACLLPVAVRGRRRDHDRGRARHAGGPRADPAGVHPPLRRPVRLLHVGDDARRALYVARGGGDDREAIQEALGGHVCRCTGYAKIVEAVAAAARGDEFDLTETAVGQYTTMTTGGAA